MTKSQFYLELQRDLDSLLAGETHVIAALANASALINERMDAVNWVGFYLIEHQRLVLGPFQGKVACTSIPIGKGVCGSAVAENRIQRIGDVDAFPGHIVCDAASKAEIVLPMHIKEQIIGVLDIDSTICQRFDEQDEQGLKNVVEILCSRLAQCDSENVCYPLSLSKGKHGN